MSKQDMLGSALAEVAGPLKDFAGKLCGVEGEVWLTAFKKFLRKENPWEIPVESASPLRPSLLELVGTVSVPVTTEKFVVRERFVINAGRKAAVTISYLGGNFREWFLGKTEEPMAETTLRCYMLHKASVDGPIIAELGGERKAETYLAGIYALMALQPRGEKGVLLTNGYANIFCVYDVNGVLRAVGVSWNAGVGGWGVGASSVGDPGGWSGGDQFFSCNS